MKQGRLHFINVRNSVFFVILVDCIISTAYLQKINLDLSQETGERLPPCAACRLVAAEFLRGLGETRRNKFDGGDAAYEQERGMKYTNSEVRLIEIQEIMCTGLKKHSSQCHNLKEQHEHLLEEWYNQGRKSRDDEPDRADHETPSLERWLCIDRLQLCCEKGFFGPDCRPCDGSDKGQPCSGHGTCRGSGSRKGNGTCKCHEGYQGPICDKCDQGFFLNTTTNACQQCDKSCVTCREAGSKGCLVCSAGYVYTQEWGCTDVDECLEEGGEQGPCSENTFCVNYDGGFQCVDCDKACAGGCYADGPDNCVRCAKGFVMHNRTCIQRKALNTQVTISRWAVHLGLIVCTIIISKKSLFLSSVIGLCVAMYIGASEYTTGEWENFNVKEFLQSFAG